MKTAMQNRQLFSMQEVRAIYLIQTMKVSHYVSMDREEEQQRRPCKRHGDEEWHGDRPMEDREIKAKRQQGMRATAGQGVRKSGCEERGRGSGSQHNWAGRRQEEQKRPQPYDQHQRATVDRGNCHFTRGTWWIWRRINRYILIPIR
jgi:hypothetical protein